MQPAAQLQTYPFYSALWNGFYNRDFYVDVITRWRGACFGYLALVVFLAGIPPLLLLHGHMRGFYQHDIPHLLSQMPVISIKNGQVSSAAGQPVVLYDVDGKPAVMIDTGGTNTNPHTAGVKILVGRDAVMVARGVGEVRSHSLAEVDDIILGKDDVQHFIDRIWPFILPVLAVLQFLVFFVWRIIQMLLYAVVAILMTKALGMRLEFFALMQVSAVALGCGVLISAALSIISVSLPSIIAIGFTLFFMWFGLKAARDWARMNAPSVAQGDR